MMIRCSFVIALLISVATCASAETQTPGARFSIDPATLPAPHETASVDNAPDVVKRPESAILSVPEGFMARLVTADMPHARNLLVAPNGDLFVARSKDGVVSILRPTSGSAPQIFEFLHGFDRPYGMAFLNGFFYVADGRGIFRVPYKDGDTVSNAQPKQVTPEKAFGDTGGPGGHWTRNLIVDRDGKHFLVAIGSRDNVAENPLPRASIQCFDIDGSGQETFASGIRNPIGMAYGPGTSDLYAVVNERDTLGDGLVPDYLARIQPGGFYGWPYAYMGPHPQPGELGQKRTDLVAKTITPDVLFDSHSAPLGLVFYTGTAFPLEYRNRAFVTMHGSWNKSQPTGYKVVSVPYENGHLKNEYYNFATGFRLDDGTASPAKVWGRPVGIAQSLHGSLYVSDDEGGTIWEIAYGK
jgi:glucose/arabinose dehydrogenase